MHDVATCQGNILVGDFHIIQQANNKGQVIACPQVLVMMFHFHRFAFNEKNNRSLPATNMERFVGRIQQEHVTQG
jgi:hypothetical protein